MCTVCINLKDYVEPLFDLEHSGKPTSPGLHAAYVDLQLHYSMGCHSHILNQPAIMPEADAQLRDGLQCCSVNFGPISLIAHSASYSTPSIKQNQTPKRFCKDPYSIAQVDSNPQIDCGKK